MHRFALLSLVLLTPAFAADWPQFRGPNGDGHYDGPKLPTEWGPAKNVAWKTPMPGEGWSSPIVWKGKVYLTAATRQATRGYSLRAICIDAATGKTDWNENVLVADPAGNIHSKNSHASPTPTTDGERLYVHFGHNGTAALDLKGKVIWTRTKLYERPVHGSGGSPILVDDMVVFSCDGADKQFVIALDKKSGKTVWQQPRNHSVVQPFSFSTPTVIDVEGKKQIVSVGSGLIAGYDAKTGKEVWRSTFSGYSLIPKPVAGNGMIYFGTGYEMPTLQAVKIGGSGDVTKSHVAWKAVRSAPHTPSPLVVGDDVYMVADRGVMTCLDAKTGAVVWEERLRGAYSASPIYADGKIYLTSEEGKGTLIEAGRKYNNLGEFDLKEKTFASFAAVDGALYVRTETQLYKFRAK